MLVTVGICTWNRAAQLRIALAAIARSTPPTALAWELLVVDNGSTDGTRSVVAEFRNALPIRRAVEPQPGLSNARNRCVDEARGAYVLWTDDDVIVDAQWLHEYARAFADHPEAAIFGGPVRPRFEAPRPAWLETVWPSVQTAYGLRDLGDALAPLDARRLPFGSNYAIRRTEQLAHRYDQRLGRKRNALLGGEEVAVMRAILGAGGRGYWLPAAAVEHWIPSERLTARYLARYYRGQGRVLALSESPAAPSWTPQPFGRPLWLWRRALEAEFVYRRDLVLHEPEHWVESLIRASTTWGTLAGWPRRR
jgi:hypothetical protein